MGTVQFDINKMSGLDLGYAKVDVSGSNLKFYSSAYYSLTMAWFGLADN